MVKESKYLGELPQLDSQSSDSDDGRRSHLTHTRVCGDLILNGVNVSGTDLRSIAPGKLMTDEAISFILQWYAELSQVAVRY
jgi:hypothetical protein